MQLTPEQQRYVRHLRMTEKMSWDDIAREIGTSSRTLRGYVRQTMPDVAQTALTTRKRTAGFMPNSSFAAIARKRTDNYNPAKAWDEAMLKMGSFQ